MGRSQLPTGKAGFQPHPKDYRRSRLQVQRGGIPPVKTKRQHKAFILVFDADAALQRLMDRYQGFELIKSNLIPSDAKRGWFRGLDGRKVRILGDTISERKHRCMSGYLQNGEAIVMKSATLLWHDKLKDYDAKLVNLVHDEWQVECPNNMNTALHIAEMMASS